MVNVIGLGYIGLPTSLMLAAHGVEVIGTDYNAALVDKLQAGIITFSEEGLSELFSQAVEQGIKFSHDYQVADTYIEAADKIAVYRVKVFLFELF